MSTDGTPMQLSCDVIIHATKLRLSIVQVNQTIPSAICNKQVKVNFPNTETIARTRRASAIWKKNTSAYLFQFAREKKYLTIC